MKKRLGSALLAFSCLSVLLAVPACKKKNGKKPKVHRMNGKKKRPQKMKAPRRAPARPRMMDQGY